MIFKKIFGLFGFPSLTVRNKQIQKKKKSCFFSLQRSGGELKNRFQMIKLFNLNINNLSW